MATTEVFAGLQKLDRAQEEASLDLGANYWQTFWRITLPNLKLPIIGAALLIFTLSMDEIAVSFFLIGRDNTLPLEIWGRLRRGITPEINAISTIIFRLFTDRDRRVVPAADQRRRSARDRRRTGRASRTRSPIVSANRRDFIKFVVAGAVASGCPVDAALFAAPSEVAPAIEGEENKICHQVRDGKTFSRPPCPQATMSLSWAAA